MSVHVEIDLSDRLAAEPEQIGREHLTELLERGLKAFRIDRALDQYADGAISFGAAARLAGVTQGELARHAYARGIEPSTSEEMLHEELG
jgi:predicted HTH domain antitoxin